MQQQNLPLAGERKLVSVSWEEVEQACKYLSSHIEGHLNSRAQFLSKEQRFRRPLLVPVVRGGLVPATILSHMTGFSIRETIHVSAYNGTVLDIGRLKKQLRTTFTRDEIKNVVFIEDIIDTGTTIEFIREVYPEAVFAAISAKPAGVQKCGRQGLDAILCEPPLKYPDNTWLEFPWEKQVYQLQEFTKRVSGSGD